MYNHLALVDAKVRQAEVIEHQLRTLERHRGPWTNRNNPKLDYIESEGAAINYDMDANLVNICKVLKHVNIFVAKAKGMRPPVEYDCQFLKGHHKHSSIIRDTKNGETHTRRHEWWSNPHERKNYHGEEISKIQKDHWNNFLDNQNVAKYHHVRRGGVEEASHNAYKKHYHEHHGYNNQFQQGSDNGYAAEGFGPEDVPAPHHGHGNGHHKNGHHNNGHHNNGHHKNGHHNNGHKNNGHKNGHKNNGQVAKQAPQPVANGKNGNNGAAAAVQPAQPAANNGAAKNGVAKNGAAKNGAAKNGVPKNGAKKNVAEDVADTNLLELGSGRSKVKTHSKIKSKKHKAKKSSSKKAKAHHKKSKKNKKEGHEEKHYKDLYHGHQNQHRFMKKKNKGEGYKLVSDTVTTPNALGYDDRILRVHKGADGNNRYQKLFRQNLKSQDKNRHLEDNLILEPEEENWGSRKEKHQNNHKHHAHKGKAHNGKHKNNGAKNGAKKANGKKANNGAAKNNEAAKNANAPKATKPIEAVADKPANGAAAQKPAAEAQKK